MAFHREHAWCVIQLLRNVLSDALHLAATTADRCGLMVDLSSGQVRREVLAFGLSLVPWCRQQGVKLRNLMLHCCQVGLELFIEQALLLG